jgi:hypothetical protein
MITFKWNKVVTSTQNFITGSEFHLCRYKLHLMWLRDCKMVFAQFALPLGTGQCPFSSRRSSSPFEIVRGRLNDFLACRKPPISSRATSIRKESKSRFRLFGGKWFNYLSNCHDPDGDMTTQRRAKNGTVQELQCTPTVGSICQVYGRSWPPGSKHQTEQRKKNYALV